MTRCARRCVLWFTRRFTRWHALRLGVGLTVGLGIGIAPVAQGEVVVWSCLDEPAASRVNQELEAAGLDATLEFRRGGAAALITALRATAGPAAVGDLVVGLDVVLCRRLRDQKLLTRYGEAWRAPLVIAYRAEVWDTVTAPHEFDDLLFDHRFEAQLVLPAPEVWPAPWVGWIERLRARGKSEQHVLDWLRTLDARVTGYAGSRREVWEALGRGEASLAVLPLGSVRGRVGLGAVVPESGMPSEVLAVALVTGYRAAARAVYDRLISPGFGRELVDVGLLPALGPGPVHGVQAGDLPGAVETAAAAELNAKLWPSDPDRVDFDRWLELWRSGVRGQGRSYRSIEIGLDIAFTIGFFVFLLFVYRRMRNPKSEQPS